MEGLLERRLQLHEWLHQPFIQEQWGVVERHWVRFDKPPFSVPKHMRADKKVKVSEKDKKKAIDLRYLITIEDDSPESSEFTLVMSTRKTYREAFHPIKTARDQSQRESQIRRAKEYSISSADSASHASLPSAVRDRLSEDAVATEQRFKGVGGVIAPYRIQCRAASHKEKQAWLASMGAFDKIKTTPYVPHHPVGQETVDLALKASLMDYRRVPKHGDGTFDFEELDRVLQEKLAHTPIPSEHADAIHTCMLHIETTGLKNRRVFKEYGSEKNIRLLVRHLLANDAHHVPPRFTIQTIVGALRTLLSRLPESLFTSRLESHFLEAAEFQNQDAINTLLTLVPDTNREIIERVKVIARHVAYNIRDTQMDLPAVALALGPTLLQKSRNVLLQEIEQALPALFEALGMAQFESPEEKEQRAEERKMDALSAQQEREKQQQADGSLHTVDEDNEDDADDADDGMDHTRRVIMASEDVVAKNHELAMAIAKERHEPLPLKDEDFEPEPSDSVDPLAGMSAHMFASITSTAVPEPKKPAAQWKGLKETKTDENLTLFERSMLRERPAYKMPDFTRHYGAAEHLPFGQAIGLSGAPEQAHPPAIEHFNDFDDIDIEASLEAGGMHRNIAGRDARQLAAEKRRQKLPPRPTREQPRPAVHKGDNLPYSTRFPQKITSAALVSPILAAPAMFALAASANAGLISSNFQTETSVIPVDKPFAQLKNCIGPRAGHAFMSLSSVDPAASASEGGQTGVDATAKSNNAGDNQDAFESETITHVMGNIGGEGHELLTGVPYDGPDTGMERAQLIWDAVLSLRQRLKVAEKTTAELELEVASDRYKAEWEDIQIYQKKHRINTKKISSAAARRQKLRLKRSQSKINRMGGVSGTTSQQSSMHDPEPSQTLPTEADDKDTHDNNNNNNSDDDERERDGGLLGGGRTDPPQKAAGGSFVRSNSSVHRLLAQDEVESSGEDSDEGPELGDPEELEIFFDDEEERFFEEVPDDEDEDGEEYSDEPQGGGGIGFFPRSMSKRSMPGMIDRPEHPPVGDGNLYWKTHTLKEAIKKKKQVDELIRIKESGTQPRRERPDDERERERDAPRLDVKKQQQNSDAKNKSHTGRRQGRGGGGSEQRDNARRQVSHKTASDDQQSTQANKSGTAASRTSSSKSRRRKVRATDDEWWEEPPRNENEKSEVLEEAERRRQRAVELLNHLDELNTQMVPGTPSMHTSSYASSRSNSPVPYQDPLEVRGKRKSAGSLPLSEGEEPWDAPPGEASHSSLSSDLSGSEFSSDFDDEHLNLADLQRGQSMLEKFIIARQKEMEKLERQRQILIAKRQLDIKTKLLQEKKDQLERIKKEAEERTWRASAPRWDASVFWNEVGRHPLRRRFEKSSARLAATRAELFDLRRQLKRLLESLDILMSNRKTQWRVAQTKVYDDLPEEEEEVVAEKQQETAVTPEGGVEQKKEMLEDEDDDDVEMPIPFDGIPEGDGKSNNVGDDGREESKSSRSRSDNSSNLEK